MLRRRGWVDFRNHLGYGAILQSYLQITARFLEKVETHICMSSWVFRPLFSHISLISRKRHTTWREEKIDSGEVRHHIFSSRKSQLITNVECCRIRNSLKIRRSCPYMCGGTPTPKLKERTHTTFLKTNDGSWTWDLNLIESPPKPTTGAILYHCTVASHSLWDF